MVAIYFLHRKSKDGRSFTVSYCIAWHFNILYISEWCKEGQYVCANARQCVDIARVCDGTPDCPLGDDEKSCVALAEQLEDNEIVPYNEEGTDFH